MPPWKAGLIAVGEAPLEPAFDQTVRTANKVTKRSIDLAPGQLAREVAEEFGSGRAGEEGGG